MSWNTMATAATRRTEVDGIHTINEWIAFWEIEHGIVLNVHTTRQRRKVAGVGRFIPPSTYLLTEAEFAKVLETPLPGCVNGAKAAR